jgi:catechol-2,3-dioxygenase
MPNSAADIVSPVKLAHIVMRTSQKDELVNWYKTVLNAKIVFDSPGIAFLGYDDEHHRVAFISVPALKPQPEGIAGVHHVAFTYPSLRVLMENFERLKALGIEPAWSVNHGPTTSLYYLDPDGNRMECQVDNYDDIDEATAFFFTDDFRDNPIGVDFNPEDILRKLRAGDAEQPLKMRPAGGARGVEDIPIQ